MLPVAIRDPIHRSIHMEDWTLPLIDSPVMQRLRRVRQLGTAHLVYPGAHHRRFEHSLGAHHLAGRFATALGLDDHEARTVRAAALLHDVGHGPFSHAFEELLREHGGRHEEMSVDLVRWGPLGDPLRQAGLDPVAVSDAILGKGQTGAIVSGALDADRLDYLLRDAHYTGVPSSADAERLIETLARDPETGGIVLNENGIIAAESILTMRFHMYPAVYLHRTVRASESMFVAAVRDFVRAGHGTLAQIARETDDSLLWKMRQAGGVPEELTVRLDERRLYKRAYEGGPSLSEEPWLKRIRSSYAVQRHTELEIAEAAGVSLHHVILDIPKPPKFRELGVRVRLRDGTLRNLPDVSRLVGVLQEARMDHWRFWVFCPKQEREQVAAAAAKVLR